MTSRGLPVRQLLSLAREASPQQGPPAPIVVVGPLAAQLVRALAEGGDPALVREGSGRESASVLVCVLGGDPTPSQREVLRVATRRGEPIVGVQTAEPREVAYIPALDVVDCPPGRGFPVAAIAAAIARVGGEDVAALAGALPVLRDAVVRDVVGGGVARAAAIAAWPGRGAHLPLILAVQVTMLRRVLTATGAEEPELPEVAGIRPRPELGVALAAGLAARSVLRALPSRGPGARAVIAAGTTLALGALVASRGSLDRR